VVRIFVPEVMSRIRVFGATVGYKVVYLVMCFGVAPIHVHRMMSWAVLALAGVIKEMLELNLGKEEGWSVDAMVLW
jgi:hypothetical protein